MTVNEERVSEYLVNHVGETISLYDLIRKTKAVEKEIKKLSADEWMEIEKRINEFAGDCDIMLDKRNHTDSSEKEPWNSELVIKSVFDNNHINRAVVSTDYEGIEKDLIYRERSHGYYHPVENSISVYDRDKDNVVINVDRYFGITEPRTLTVSRELLEKVKTAISNSGVMNIESFKENNEIMIMDGEANSFYFSVSGERKLIECDNFYMLYDGFDDSNARKVMKLTDKIERLLKKEVKW